MSIPRILILDDEKEINQLLVTLLTRSGYEVVSCLTGEDAVDRFQEAESSDHPVGLLLLDLTIPLGMNEGVLYSDSLAKYAAAFFRMSRSSSTRRSSARSF